MSASAYEDMPTEQLTIRSRILKIPGLKLIQQVGEGGMSTVWKAWDIPNQRLVAVKILNRQFSSDGAEVRHFRAEERILEEIRHPGIVEAYDFDNGNGNWYYVMEYVDGYTFADLLRRKQHVSETDCLLICESIASALDYAWNDHGVVHCDIKPENIMCDSDGRVKVADLGLCQSTNVIHSEEAPDMIVGTPAYMSPEQIYADQPLDCRADIYCLGATLYHLSTGRTLFPIASTDDILRAHVDPEKSAPDPRTFNPSLSENFVRLLGHMLVKDPANRCQTWDDVLDAAQAVEEDRTILPIPEGVASSVHIGL